ncbi:MAG: polysaccharide biosynthesis protein [Clostridia bacterium]|nr:polysaccharide biosynthesis protein [Clostridia bacterium]
MKKNYKKLKELAVVCACDFAALTLSMLFALLIVDGTIAASWDLLYWYLANIGFVYVFFALFRLYFLVFNSVGIVDTLKIIAATVFIFIVNVPFVFVFDLVHFSTVFTFCVLLAILAMATRFSKRMYYTVKYSFSRKTKDKVRTLIVGAGNAGSMLIREIQTTDKIDYLPICIVDDDKDKVGKSINGVKVLGTTEDIPSLAERYAIDEILIAIPAAPKSQVKRIYELCKTTNCKVKTLPGIYQIVSGEASVSALREVQISDLLGRDQIQVNLDEIMGYIENQVIMVTGGGGSIGSELCRQIATHNPKQLIILDIYENNAYDIEQELKRSHPELNLLALIASVRDVTKIDDVFKKYRPDIIFNAAAHKHVPLMETSPNEAVKNNVFGTLNVARCADKYGAKTFVQISTDKAVNPTNVMGATKRICEMIIQTIGKHSKHTNFVAVRFGNVLGSNGSVIPLFEKQIADGGPVTVTHKDIIRYFMTIPEAVSLVLQAGAYAKGGQIFVLDMGEPVKIYDLAYNLIKLSGLEPNVDIDIVCTGLRPGEKLFEERLMDEEGMQKTPNGLINIANPIELDEELLWKSLDELHEAAVHETTDMRHLIAKLVPTYTIKN